MNLQEGELRYGEEAGKKGIGKEEWKWKGRKESREVRIGIRVRRCLTIDAAYALALVRALIHSRLDYCNGLFA